MYCVHCTWAVVINDYMYSYGLARDKLNECVRNSHFPPFPVKLVNRNKKKKNK